MQKRKGRLLVNNLVLGQIFLILLSIFSFAFLISEIHVVIGSGSSIPTSTDSLAQTNVATGQIEDRFGNPIGENPDFPGVNPGDVPAGDPTNPTDPTAGLGITALISDIFKGQIGNPAEGAAGFHFGPLVAGLAWGATLALAVNLLGGVFGLDDQLTSALSTSVFVGSVAGGGVASLVQSGVLGSGGEILGVSATTAGAIVGIGVAVAVFLATYKDEEREVVHFQCLPFEPPLGGNSCESCNDDPFRSCSEYRCRSLGQACELVNPGTEDEKCVWVNPGDVNSPVIKTWPDALTDGHTYSPHATRPSDRGTKITRSNAADGCLQAFTALEFGITTNEPAQCKIDYVHTESFDEMQFFLGETNLLLEEHEQRMSLPSPDSIGAELSSPELENDGIYDLFVRCRDANGNENTDEFVFNFCVDPSPDTTPPVIVDTSIENGGAVSFESQEANVEVYVNEPAQCKWSSEDKDYEEMENAMQCSTSITEINAQQLYTCSAGLTGLKDREENKYYFRCKDQPSKPDSERNVNAQSYEFVLRGSQPLDIISVMPDGNETIADSAEFVSVDLELETSNGADEGEAICYFSPSGEEGSYVAMFETDSFTHRQTLSLLEGEYTYYFRCVDSGGNSEETSTTFSVETDTDAPQVTRAYKELDALKVITNEDAECSYSLNNCNFNFDEGISMLHTNPNMRMSHFAEWQSNIIYYVKCRDDFGNQPEPNQCSLIASATNIA